MANYCQMSDFRIPFSVSVSLSLSLCVSVCVSLSPPPPPPPHLSLSVILRCAAHTVEAVRVPRRLCRWKSFANCAGRARVGVGGGWEGGRRGCSVELRCKLCTPFFN